MASSPVGASSPVMNLPESRVPGGSLKAPGVPVPEAVRIDERTGLTGAAGGGRGAEALISSLLSPAPGKSRPAAALFRSMASFAPRISERSVSSSLRSS